MPKVIVKKDEKEKQQIACQLRIDNEADFTKLITYLHYFLNVANCEDNIVEIRLRKRLR